MEVDALLAEFKVSRINSVMALFPHCLGCWLAMLQHNSAAFLLLSFESLEFADDSVYTEGFGFIGGLQY